MTSSKPSPCPAGADLFGSPDEGSMYCERPDGRRHGPYTTWHENGRKEEEGTYTNGDRVGRWREWDADGKLVKDVDYAAPILICAFDDKTRRAVAAHVTLRGITVAGTLSISFPPGTADFIRESNVPAGKYEVEWWPSRKPKPAPLIVELGTRVRAPIMIAVDATGHPSSFIGGPSRCAPPP